MKSPSHPALSSAASASADCDRIVREKVNKDTIKNDNDNDNKKAAEMEKDAEKEEEEEEKQGSIRGEETLSNTIFLLQYSFLDISGDVRWIRNNSNSGRSKKTVWHYETFTSSL